MSARSLIVGVSAVNCLIGFLLGVAADRHFSSGEGSPLAELAPLQSGSLQQGAVAAVASRGAQAKASKAKRGGRRGRILLRLARHLKLSADQRGEVEEILGALHERFRSEIRPLARKLQEGAEADIVRVLTPEQRVRFQELQRERRAHWKRRRGRFRGHMRGKGHCKGKPSLKACGLEAKREGGSEGRSGVSPKRQPSRSDQTKAPPKRMGKRSKTGA